MQGVSRQAKKTAMSQALSDEVTYENVQKMTVEDWRDEIFPRFSLQNGNILADPMDCELVLTCGNKIESRDKSVGRAFDNFGSKEGLRKQGKLLGEERRKFRTH